MKIWRFLLFPFALIYGAITSFRNGLYQIGLFKSSKFSLPLINIGNLSMGGTGKTPHTEYLIKLLQKDYKLVTLSRGFGRKERGFILGDDNSSARQIGDEPFQYLRKFGHKIGVAVDANRVEGVMEICRNKPDTKVILLDDAFQHRAIQAGFSILITPYDDPFFNDFIVPVGRLRESRRGKTRANVLIVSKCPSFEQINKADFIRKIRPNKNQKVFFSKINYGQAQSVKNADQYCDLNGKKIIVVTGIANPTSLIRFLQEKNTILKHFEFADHYNFRPTDILTIHNLFGKFAHEEVIIVTTEKDAMRLLAPDLKAELDSFPWFYQPIEVQIDEAHVFNQMIIEYVEKDS